MTPLAKSAAIAASAAAAMYWLDTVSHVTPPRCMLVRP